MPPSRTARDNVVYKQHTGGGGPLAVRGVASPAPFGRIEKGAVDRSAAPCFAGASWKGSPDPHPARGETSRR